MKGLFRRKEKTTPVATKVLNGKNVRLAVVLSKNTINNIKYLQGYKQFCEGGEGNPILQPRMRKACAEAADPDYFIQWITRSMTSNFGEVKFYDSQDQAKNATPDVFAIVNIFYDPRGSDYDVADVKIKFFDRNFDYVAAAQGTGKIPADHWGAVTVSGNVAISKQHAQVRTTALLSMDQSLSTILVHPINWHSTASAARNE